MTSKNENKPSPEKNACTPWFILKQHIYKSLRFCHHLETCKCPYTISTGVSNSLVTRYGRIFLNCCKSQCKFIYCSEFNSNCITQTKTITIVAYLLVHSRSVFQGTQDNLELESLCFLFTTWCRFVCFVRCFEENWHLFFFFSERSICLEK